MLVVLAGVLDDEAATLVARWRDHDAVLVTPRDLSGPGWVDGDGVQGALRASGRVRSTRELSGVLVRLAGVLPEELVDLVGEDRPYASAEMTAFLTHWLCALPVPVLNRPSPMCLLGPAWSNEQWLVQAARLGAPVRDVVVSREGATAPGPAAPTGEVLLVAGRPVRASADLPAAAVDAAAALAQKYEIALMRAFFVLDRDGPWLTGIDLRPPLTSHAASDATLELLLAGGQ